MTMQNCSKLSATAVACPAICAAPMAAFPFPVLSLSSIRPGFARQALIDVAKAFLATIAALLVATVVYAGEVMPEWVPSGLSIPDDAEVMSNKSVSSSLKMFSMSTDADVDALFSQWKDDLRSEGYMVKRGASEFLGPTIEFSGPGILNAKIAEATTSRDDHTVIKFDATLE